MPVEENKKLIRRYFETFGQGDVEIFDSILSPGFYVRGLHESVADIPESQRGSAIFKQAALAWRNAFPDNQITVDEIVAEGNTVIARWTVRATHRGEFAGLPPTNQEIAYSGVNGFRLADGILVEAWDLWDRLSLWQQLRVLPATAEFLEKARASPAK